MNDATSQSAAHSPDLTIDHRDAGVPLFGQTPTQPAVDGAGQDRFEILSEHARGGLGEVYLARDVELGRTVAYKKLQARFADDAESRQRFLLEAQVTGGLEHPAIVPVYALGTDGSGQPYYAMRFIKGDSLEAALHGFHEKANAKDAAARRQQFRGLLRRLIDVCNAMSYAHSRGVLHRDLKPANIMLGKYGETLVVDWGLAKTLGDIENVPQADESRFRPLTGEDSSRTQLGQALGTPAYMSPEQAAGQWNQLGPASDIYNLGATLYAVLTGQSPQQGRDLQQVMHRVRHGQFEKPRQIRASISPALEAICLKAMALNPADRYGSAQQLADDLERWLADEPVSAYHEGLGEKLGRLTRKHRAVSLVGLATAVLITVVSVVAAISIYWARNQAVANAAAELLQRQRAEDLEKVARQEAENARCLANFTGAQYMFSQDKLREAFKLASAAYASHPAWEYARHLAAIVEKARSEWRLIYSANVAETPRWAALSRDRPPRLALGFADRVELRELRDGGRTISAPLAGTVQACPLGSKQFAVAQDNGAISIVSFADLTVSATLPDVGKVEQLACSENGQTIAALLDDGEVRIISTDGRSLAKRRFELAKSGGAFPEISLAPNGKRLAFNSGIWSEAKQLWDWEADAVTEVALQAHRVQFAADEALVGLWANADASEEMVLLQLDLRDGQERATRFTNGIYRRDARLEVAATPDAQFPAIAVRVGDALNVVKYPPKNADATKPTGEMERPTLKAVRFASLWPHTESSITLLDYQADSQTLALVSQGRVLVFANGQNPDQVVFYSWDTSFWSFYSNGRELFSCEDQLPDEASRLLYCLDMVEGEWNEPIVEAPEPREGCEIHAWGVAATPDGKRVAVLWQENSGGGTIGSEFYRKIARLYARDHALDQAKLVAEIELVDFANTPGRANRQFILTADAGTVALCSSAGRLVGYRVADGKQAYDISVGNSHAWHAGNGLFATARFDSPGDLTLYDLRTGKEHARWPLNVAIQRMCFAPDGKNLYVGAAENRLRQYEVKTGKLLREVATPVVPIAISPLGNRYLGFAAENGATGRLVLADLNDGRDIEVLSSASHVLNSGCFSPDGKSIYFLEGRSRVAWMQGVSPNEAKEILEKLQPFPDKAPPAK